MSGLTTSSPAMARLFEDVDLASVPQSTLGRDARTFWQSQRKGKLMPSSSRLITNMPKELSPFVFLFTADETSGEYQLAWAGNRAIAELTSNGVGTHLDAFRNRRLAARLRLVLDLVKSRGEPVTVRFGTRLSSGKKVNAELFIAPTTAEASKELEFFGSLVFRREKYTW